MVFQKLGLNATLIKSLVGAVLFKLGMSITSCWGNINLYFLSKFHYQGSHITPQTNAFILLISVLPMILALLASTKLCNRFGRERVIRFCSVMFCLSPLITIFVFNLPAFVVFSIIIPGSMFAVTSIPILNCMWTLFPDSKNKITAVLVVAFGLGGILWNVIFTYMINPNNEDTSVELDQIHLFPEQVTRNLRRTAIIGFGVAGGLAVLGSFLVGRMKEEGEVLQEQIETQNQKQPEAAETPTTGTNLNYNTTTELTFGQALRDQKFVIIMAVSFLTGLYEIHLIMNYKIIYMPIVSDDHFLSYTNMLCSLVALLGAFLWGCLGDCKGVAFTILVLSILDFGSKLFSDFALNKTMIVIMVVLIGLISRSMTTLAGPGFVQYFGLNVGTQLLPFKGVAILLGYMMVPLLQIVTAQKLSPHEYLVFLSYASVVTLACAIRLFVLDRGIKRRLQAKSQGQGNQGVEAKEKNNMGVAVIG